MNSTTFQTAPTKTASPAPSGLLQRSCACGNHTSGGGACDACRKQKHSSFQTKLRVSEPGDRFEQEADWIADRVMASSHTHAGGGVIPGTTSKIQRSTSQTDASQSRTVSHEEQAVATSGTPLTPEVRAFFEPRFGHDFSGVRVHSDPQAASAAEAIQARAYTTGNDIVFASGEFNPGSTGGQRLIAHELAHVIQQEGGQPAVQRTLAATSTCRANVHDAPADPISELRAADERAQLMALGTSHVLFFEALTFADPIFGRSYVSDAYERRFGLAPAAAGGRFRNRFTGRLYPTQDDAMREEMFSLGNRFRTLHTFLSGPIHYRCPGTSRFTLPGCREITCGGSIAWSCPGGRQIAICSTFWTYPDMQTVDQRGGNMIHEAVHMRLHFGGHGLGNLDQRGRNPECHSALVADIYGFQSDDTVDCTPLIP